MTTPASKEGDATAADERTPVVQDDPHKGTAPPDKPFTQDDINKAAAAARREESAKYSDYEALKTQAAEGAELKRQQMTAEQKMSSDLATEQAKTARLEGSIADTMISAEVRVRAAAMGIVDPDAALLLIDRSSVVYTSADGKVAGVDEALTVMLEAKPYLKGTALPVIPTLNGGPGNPGPTPKPLTEEQRTMADHMKIPHDIYARGLNQTGPIAVEPPAK